MKRWVAPRTCVAWVHEWTRAAVFALEGLSSSEYARALGLPASAVSCAMFRLWQRGDVKRHKGGGPRGGDTWYRGMGTTRPYSVHT